MEIAEETKAIFSTFPELRRKGRGFDAPRLGGRRSNSGPPARRRPRMSARRERRSLRHPEWRGGQSSGRTADAAGSEIRFIEDVQEALKDRDDAWRDAVSAECLRLGHEWRDLQTNPLGSSTAHYCTRCLRVRISGAEFWPTFPGTTIRNE